MTPWQRAGVSETEYRRWASGAAVAYDVRAAILAAAPREPLRRARVNEKGQIEGFDEIERAAPSEPEGGQVSQGAGSELDEDDAPGGA